MCDGHPGHRDGARNLRTSGTEAPSTQRKQLNVFLRILRVSVVSFLVRLPLYVIRAVSEFLKDAVALESP
jgi:hypothetical protein